MSFNDLPGTYTYRKGTGLHRGNETDCSQSFLLEEGYLQQDSIMSSTDLFPSETGGND